MAKRNMMRIGRSTGVCSRRPGFLDPDVLLRQRLRWAHLRTRPCQRRSDVRVNRFARERSGRTRVGERQATLQWRDDQLQLRGAHVRDRQVFAELIASGELLLRSSGRQRRKATHIQFLGESSDARGAVTCPLPLSHLPCPGRSTSPRRWPSLGPARRYSPA
jgi:hypothetical protein